MDFWHVMKCNKQEMRFLTKRLRDKDEEDVVIGDWKFAAMVIDRCNVQPPNPLQEKENLITEKKSD